MVWPERGPSGVQSVPTARRVIVVDGKTLRGSGTTAVQLAVIIHGHRLIEYRQLAEKRP